MVAGTKLIIHPVQLEGVKRVAVKYPREAKKRALLLHRQHPMIRALLLRRPVAPVVDVINSDLSRSGFDSLEGAGC